MIKAIRIHRNGEPDEMQWEDIELPPPAAGEVRVRHTAIALNFSDVNVRRGGFYITPPSAFPLILGNEAAGIVASIGAGVDGLKPGDRVAYVGVGGPFYENTGAYAAERNVPAACLITLPEGISEHQAAALLLKGLTASLVINRIYKPKHGDTILIHAAASGVGLLLCQWAKHLGAGVIGTVGTAAKAQLVREHGCDHTILYRDVDFVPAVKNIVPKGVHAVFDGVGKDTFIASFDCTRPFGMLVNYGNASGHVPPIDLLLLAKKGSLSVCRPAYSSHVADPKDYRAACDELFDFVERGVLRVETGSTYALRDAAQAHRDLEARRTVGSTVLVP
ncbi:MAG: quinone oxidoreductase [Candidatus Lustribacter sp.]|jgi:NADPH2:quinone reductase